MTDILNNSGSIPGRGRWYERVSSHPLFHPVFLLFLCFLAYGVLLPWLSFYADDWILLWIYQKLGAWGVNYYHVTNRPFLAPLYQILLPLLGSEPWRWQFLAVLAPWLTSLSGWLLIRSLWPKRVQLAIFASILIAVFPGYLSHGVALNMAHRDIILAIFFLSLACSALSLRYPGRFWFFYLLALLTSIYNMLAMEYFLFMELSRPFVVWIVLSETDLPLKEKSKKTVLHTAPFLAAFCGIVYWRVFLFPYQTYNYSTSLFNIARKTPYKALLYLARQTVQFFWTGTFRVWLKPILTPISEFDKTLTYLGYVFISLATGTFTYLFLLFFPVKEKVVAPTKKRLGANILLLSIIPWLLGGIPFILVGLQPGVGGYETRFNLPFMLVTCLWVTFGIIILLKKYLIQILVISTLVGLSAGQQFLSSNELRVIGIYRREFFWNLSYRLPDLEPGTLIVGNDFSTGDGSTAWTYILNWLYEPELENNQLPYMIIQGSLLPQFLNSSTNEIEILGAHFKMDPSKIVFLNYNYGRCPQIYNPDFPAELPTLDPRVEQYIKMATTQPILSSINTQTVDPASIHLGAEPPKGWCYYYEKADLARQLGDWQTVQKMGDEAIFAQNLEFKNYAELSPFILGYAIGNKWEKATEILSRSIASQEILDGSTNVSLLTGIRDFVIQNTTPSTERDQFLKIINDVLN